MLLGMSTKKVDKGAKYSCMTNHCKFRRKFFVLICDIDKHIYIFVGVDPRCACSLHDEINISRQYTT